MVTKILFAGVLMLGICTTATAIAQNRVVVIPLNTGGSAGANGVQTVTSATGKVWMDRNLGALRSALGVTDKDAYGGLFQWGRLNDGHAIRTSPTTTTLSSGDVPGHGDFIASTAVPFDWRNPQNDNLWQGVIGTNNPCPAGFRLPTDAEWDDEINSWTGGNNIAGAFGSPLKLAAAGYRNRRNGILTSEGSDGYYWSSTILDTTSRYLFVSSGSAYMSNVERAYGFSVRCLRD